MYHMKLIGAALLMVLMAVAVMAAPAPTPKVIYGHWGQAVTFNDDGTTAERVFITERYHKKDLQEVLGAGHLAVEQVTCIAWMSGTPGNATCGSYCGGQSQPGQCCWICLDGCGKPFSAPCPPASGGGSTGMCKGRICMK